MKKIKSANKTRITAGVNRFAYGIFMVQYTESTISNTGKPNPTILFKIELSRIYRSPLKAAFIIIITLFPFSID